MRTVYLGTSTFGAAVLRRLAESSHRPELVISQPDRPKGRGRRVAPPPVALAAKELELPLAQPKDVNSPESLERVAASKPDVACLCAYGQLIKEPLLTNYRMLNVHPSLLPRWRGAAPIERAIMAGDKETGVSIMKVAPELDAGDVCWSVRTAIGSEETGEELAGRLEELAGGALVEALQAMEDGKLEFAPQDDSQATYAEKVESADRHLDLNRPAQELARVVRALSSHIGACITTADGRPIKVLAARPTDDEIDTGRGEVRDQKLLIGCGEGSLELLELQPAGKRPMPASAYLVGHQLPLTLRA